MGLLFQSDDFGITEAVTLGIVKGIREGLIRNTGLFTNMPSSAFAAAFIPEFPECCFGVDINLFAGKPLSDPQDVPSLVDSDGHFITSIQRYQNNEIVAREGVNVTFAQDPFVYDEVYLEMERQVQRFIELTGKKPEYLHPHSLITPIIDQAFQSIALKYDLLLSYAAWEEKDLWMFPADWNVKPVFTVENQMKTNVAEKVLAMIDQVNDHQHTLLVCHAGYIDAALLKLSSYSIIRAKDLEMALSEDLAKYLKDTGIELITYRDLR